MLSRFAMLFTDNYFNTIYRPNLLLMLFTSIDLNFMDILLKSKNINS